MTSFPLITEPYETAVKRWPKTGQVILAQYDDCGIWVYQAYKPGIVKYAAKHKRLEGAPGFRTQRMSWIKTNFLWMQYRSGWCSKKDQERCLAIKLTRDFFDYLVRSAVDSHPKTTDQGRKAMEESDVRLQWDPDHTPSGGNCERRAIQLGLRRCALAHMASGNPAAVLDMVDVTDFVVSQRDAAYDKAQRKDLIVPVECEYIISESNNEKNGDLIWRQSPASTIWRQLSPASTNTCAIFLGGGFNPLLTQHVALLERVKQYLETEHNWTVTKGYFVPSHSAHIAKKDASRVIKDEHRLAISRAAVAGTDWLECMDKPYGSAGEAARQILSEGSPYVIVVGGDRAMSGGKPKWLRPLKPSIRMMGGGPMTVCVGRAGDEKSENAYNRFVRDKEDEGKTVNPNFHFLEVKLAPVSSTSVRERIHKAIEAGSADPVRRLVDEGMIFPSTADYIEANLLDLFMNHE